MTGTVPSSGTRRLATRLRRGLIGLLAGGVTGAAVMLAANLRFGTDRAADIAQALGLPGGPILAAIVGAALAGGLALGGRETIIRAYALTAGLAAVYAVFALGRPHTWILSAIVTAAFGPEAAPYAGLLAFLLLALAFRLAAPLGQKGVEALLRGET